VGTPVSEPPDVGSAALLAAPVRLQRYRRGQTVLRFSARRERSVATKMGLFPDDVEPYADFVSGAQWLRLTQRGRCPIL
jgi:hypothetical protein